MPKPEIGSLTAPGDEITVRVTPKASRNMVKQEGETLRVYVTTVPENGKANAAVQKLLAKALGVPKSSLTLVRGATSRDKTFRISR
ncbi:MULTISPECIES: DUF167 domain-containing protein [Halocynthiibacter]|uniref:UPF0235 protein OH136_04125 n=1 Tax=Halocynthiibacter halioticoli TaxID=2986804 RepID=A0AAE3IX33_9RHOB|nr:MULTISPECIES: DUF167 domain-containing protein [Halocynthiibacter]MCV6823735.1 DUF167 domain-containing protein [Halocynthiibacter halioticoli]MCW4056736.1 DUF167 domain-containing protein [Halocynthiibacter sp. SDUM655004]